MRPATLWWFYRSRLRAAWRQEVLAGAGIAIGVALAFAVMVTNGSIAASSDQIVRGIVGSADLQLRSRDSAGFDQRVVAEVRALPHVERAGLLLDQRAVLTGPDGQAGVNLASLDDEMAEMSSIGGSVSAPALRLFRGVVLTRAAAKSIGFEPGAGDRHIRLEVRGVAARIPVAAALGSDTIGSLSSAPIAVLPLDTAQSMTGLRGRVTRILVQSEPGRVAEVRRELQPLADRLHLSITPAMAEAGLLKQALGPSDWTTGFFAAISAMLGFLLAFNAMLLTSPERRRSLATLRLNGYRRRQVAAILLSQALLLGLIASLIGVATGAVVATVIFGPPDAGYLAPAFVPGSRNVFSLWPAIIAVLGGTVACLGASAPPLADLRKGRAIDDAIAGGGEAQGQALGATTRGTLPLVALGALVAAGMVLWFAPQAALVACALLAVATVAATPPVFSALLSIASSVSSRGRMPTLLIATFSLRATTIRSLALASTGALAVFGTIAIVGARADLLRGIGQYTDDYVATADLWVVNPIDNQATGSIALTGLADRIAAVPGVQRSREYQGSFLDMADRRVWIIARPDTDPSMLPASQIAEGDYDAATTAVRAGGAVSISTKLADALDVGVGDTVTLPTPTGDRSWKVAALTTNLGWTPGAIVMRAADYRRAWATAAASAIEVDLRAGANAEVTRRAIAASIGPRAGLRVQSAAERADGINASARQGLDQLRQISSLMLLGAVLAMATAMSAAIWQRRASLAALRIHGHPPSSLWRLLLVESLIVLAAGCIAGTAIGVLGQVGIDLFLADAIGFPVAPTPISWTTFEVFLAVLAAALLMVAIPGHRAARVDPALGLQE